MKVGARLVPDTFYAQLAALLRGEVREIYPQFSGRLAEVEKMSDGIG